MDPKLNLDIEYRADSGIGRFQRARVGAHRVDDFLLLDQRTFARARCKAVALFTLGHFGDVAIAIGLLAGFAAMLMLLAGRLKMYARWEIARQPKSTLLPFKG